MTVVLEDIFMIKELKQKGWTLTAIAEETGYDRKTIRKYLNQEKLPQATKRKSSGSKLDPYKSYILARIKEGTINCAVLLEEIQKLGYEGKSTILREFVQPYRAAPKKQATVRYETKPGEQAQVDWAENAGTCIIDGEEIQLYAFIMILSYSRKRYIEFTTDMKQDTLIKCHLNAFSYFNGVPQQILYDNMRTVVTKHSIQQIRFNKRFEDFLNYYDVTAKACKPYRAQTKGKVERAIDYLRNNFLTRKLPNDLTALNESLHKWLNDIVHTKKNQTTQQTPHERFIQEQAFLKPWNHKPLYSLSSWQQREVSKDCLISFEGNQYSVPYRYVGQTVKLRIEDEKLQIYDGIECIATHSLSKKKHQMVQQTSHYAGLPGTKKEQKTTDSNGLATPKSVDSTLSQAPDVEQRSLAIYALFEEGDQV